MREKVTSTSTEVRERVVVFLAFLTSDGCMEACRRHAASEELAAVLARLWFDEIYVPGEHYLYGLKGDRSDEELARFYEGFSEEEIAALERFHGFFELRLDFVSNSALGRAFFPDNDSWRSLVQHAAYVLEMLEPDPDRLRAILARFVDEVLQQETEGAVLDFLRQPKLLRG